MQVETDLEEGIQSRNSTSSDVDDKEGNDSGSQTAGSDIEAGYPIAKIDWDSPDDMGNPQNWPFWKKAFHTMVAGLCGFAL